MDHAERDELFTAVAQDLRGVRYRSTREVEHGRAHRALRLVQSQNRTLRRPLANDGVPKLADPTSNCPVFKKLPWPPACKWTLRCGLL